MKRFGLFGGLLVVLVLGVMSVVAVTSASAAPEWLCASEKVSGSTECLTLTENLETLTLEDMGVPARVECPPATVLSEGWAGPGAADEVTSVTFLECVKGAKAENLKKEEVANGCETVEKLSAVNTPWKTALENVGGVFWDKVSGAAGKPPGYLVTCKVAGVKGIADECLTPEAKPPLVLVENLSELEGSLLLVASFFNKEPKNGEEEFANCKSLVTNEKDGLVFGENLATAVRGGVAVSLEISEP